MAWLARTTMPANSAPWPAPALTCRLCARRAATRKAIATTATALIAAAFVIQFLTPPEISLGQVVVILVLIVGLLVPARQSGGLAALALLLETVSILVGSVNWVVGGAVIVSILAAFFLSIAIRRALVAGKLPFASAQGIPNGHRLTPREREVASLATAGFTSPEIGERLFIGERTVETHLVHIYEKTGLRSKRDLLQFRPLEPPRRPGR